MFKAYEEQLISGEATIGRGEDLKNDLSTLVSYLSQSMNSPHRDTLGP